MKVENLLLVCSSVCAGILTPVDEFQYWADLSESGDRSTVRERAAHFSELFKPIEKAWTACILPLYHVQCAKE